MYLKRQEKRGNGSKAAPVPQHLLCSDCHDKHANGTDITLGDGTVKRHYQQKDDADDDRKAKNKEKNQRRKARKAEASKWTCMGLFTSPVDAWKVAMPNGIHLTARVLGFSIPRIHIFLNAFF